MEDTPVIINNLKQLQIQLDEEIEQKVILLENASNGEITGKSFENDEEITIINKDLKIATLMEDANVDIEIQIDLGRGYVPSEINEKYIEIIGTIPIDAVFLQLKGLSTT